MKKFYIVLCIAIVLVLVLASSYNGLVNSNEAVTTQWAQVETSYQRRFDLIPNLVESVKGAMGQEQAVFQALADARSRYSGASTPDQKATAATQVESALSRLLVVVENYPDLKSVNAVQGFMAELAGTENRVSVERMRYNEVAQIHNIKVKRFPTSITAAIFGFEERSYFEANESAATAPSVQF